MQKIKAKKSLGQNFLIDEEALSTIAHSLDIADRHIIEVWPGYGALTEYILSHHPKSLDMVELDPDMIEILDERFMGEDIAPIILWEENTLIKTTPIAIHHQDVLTFTPGYTEYSIIANIPYYITSPILFHFLYPKLTVTQTEDISVSRDWGIGGDNGDKIQNWEQNWQHRVATPEGFATFSSKSTVQDSWKRFSSPQEMTIMMQEEVGEKILAGRNKKPHYSYISLAMELACTDIEIVRYVGRASFDPAPKVDSIVLKFSVKSSRDREMEEQLLTLWRVAFTHPRKTLMSNLKWLYDVEILKQWMVVCGYDEKVRAEAVGMEEWKRFEEICISL